MTMEIQSDIADILIIEVVPDLFMHRATDMGSISVGKKKKGGKLSGKNVQVLCEVPYALFTHARRILTLQASKCCSANLTSYGRVEFDLLNSLHTRRISKYSKMLILIAEG